MSENLGMSYTSQELCYWLTDPGLQLEDKVREVERKPGPLGTALPMEFWDCQLGASLFECLQETPIQIQLAKAELIQIKD